ncbi:hypothetical protein N7507_008175 [Penicillium longicatenatum]|nr:hypothetical protein N7507_008175 [Penicillium longicatenatum]
MAVENLQPLAYVIITIAFALGTVLIFFFGFIVDGVCGLLAEMMRPRSSYSPASRAPEGIVLYIKKAR